MFMALDTTATTTLTSVFGDVMDWFGTILQTIGTEPLLLIGIAMFVVSCVIGLVFKALHGRG